MISIAGLDKAHVLMALYNGSEQMGHGVLDPKGRSPMTIDEAREHISYRDRVYLENNYKRDSKYYFDYLNGRVMKICLDHDELETAAYNRDNGAGKAELIIKQLREANNL